MSIILDGTNGITYPDATTQASRGVPATGGTITGNLTVNNLSLNSASNNITFGDGSRVTSMNYMNIYLDPTNGNDSNNGLTTSSAVATLAKACSLAPAGIPVYIVVPSQNTVKTINVNGTITLTGQNINLTTDNGNYGISLRFIGGGNIWLSQKSNFVLTDMANTTIYITGAGSNVTTGGTGAFYLAHNSSLSIGGYNGVTLYNTTQYNALVSTEYSPGGVNTFYNSRITATNSTCTTTTYIVNVRYAGSIIYNSWNETFGTNITRFYAYGGATTYASSGNNYFVYGGVN